MRVMKFGGGCLRSADDFIRVSKILADTGIGQGTAVVSAIFGVTDRLQEAARGALEGEESIPAAISVIKEMHTSIAGEIADALTDSLGVADETRQIFEKLERLLYGIAYTGELSDSVRNLILSQGERLSARLLAATLRAQGISSRALDSDEIGILTDGQCDNATAILTATRSNLSRIIMDDIQHERIPIITGFFGCTEDGRVSSFGRNGSDYSAAVIAYALKADEIIIWKNVDGFMTADPKLVRSPSRIANLSYREAAELSYFGARILHPRTVEPLYAYPIPIHVMNISNTQNEGTLINAVAQTYEDIIKSITYNADLSVLKIHGAGVGYKPGIIGEIGQNLSNRRINIYSVITSQTCINLLLDADDGQSSERALKPLVGGVVERLELRTDLALVAVVGEGLLRTHGLAAKVFSAVARVGINVEMFSAGASDVAYYFVVSKDDLHDAIRAVHQEFFMNE